MTSLIRQIQEKDVPAVAALYRKCCGPNYPYQDFYKPDWVKKGVFDDYLFWLVIIKVFVDVRDTKLKR